MGNIFSKTLFKRFVDNHYGRKNISHIGSTATEAIYNLYKNTHKCYVVISDSYGGYNLSTDYLKNNLTAKLPDVDFKSISCVAGACFNSGDATFDKLLAKTDLNGVTDIILVGGFNDRESSQENIMQGIKRVRDLIDENIRIHIGHHAWSSLLESSVRDLLIVNSIPSYRKCSTYNNCFYMKNYEYVMHDYSLFQEDNVHPNENGAQQICRQIARYIETGTCDVHYQYKVLSFQSGYNTANAYEVAYVLDNDLVTIYLPTIPINFTNPITCGVNNNDTQLLQVEYPTGDNRGYMMGMYDARQNVQHVLSLNGYFKTDANGTPLYVGMEGCKFVLQGGFIHMYNNTIAADGINFQVFNAVAMEIRGGTFTIPTLAC